MKKRRFLYTLQKCPDRPWRDDPRKVVSKWYELVGRDVTEIWGSVSEVEKASSDAALTEANRLIDACDKGDGVDVWMVKEYAPGMSKMLFRNDSENEEKSS